MQASARRAPHSRQNLARSGFSCWHRRHFIEILSQTASASFAYAVLKRYMISPKTSVGIHHPSERWIALRQEFVNARNVAAVLSTVSDKTQYVTTKPHVGCGGLFFR